MKNKNILFFALAVVWLSLPVDRVLAVASQEVSDDSGADSSGVSGAYLAGRFARNSGDMDAAVQSLQRIHKLQPDDVDITRQLQGMLLLQGDIEQASKLSEDIRGHDKNDPLSTLIQALQAVKQGDMQQASNVLGSNKGAVPTQLWQPLLMGWIDASQKRLNKPIKVEDLSVNIGRAMPLVYYHLALINNYSGFTKEAALDFSKAVPDAKNPPARVMRSLLRFYRDNDEPAALKDLVEDYRILHPKAKNEGKLPLVANPQDGIAEILYTMGGVMLGAGVNNEAAIYLQLALYMRPEFSEVAQALGDVYSEFEQYQQSSQYYARVAKENPLYKAAQLRIAVNYERMGDLDAAFLHLDAISDELPKEADALITKGDLMRVHGRYADAIGAYDKALERIGKPSGTHWMVLFARGACYEREGNWQEAEKDLRMALELSPNQPDVLNYLGFGMMERGKNIAEAYRMVETALKARPDDGQILDSMGWAMYLQGHYDDAEEYIERAVEILPGDSTVNDHLGDVYWRVGRKIEAQYQWERSLTYSPDEELAQNIRKKLEKGLPPVSVIVPTTVPSKSANIATP